MSGPQLVTSYVEMIPPRVRGALYFSGFLLPMLVGYLVLRGWAGQPELWLASSWSGLTNAIAGAQIVAGNIARLRASPPPPRDEVGGAVLPPEPPTALVLAVLVVIVALVLLLLGGALR